ncbi:hypothetical protein C5167_012479 [Papaver somniferum]|uniref:FACT complex subunit n=1 Tax=Papaver somniferum TaxID=3469 RepID=A0A4Y7J1J2_PAPSO|nr:hypothetical protein C5167_012479 [Papaver somniferum]
MGIINVFQEFIFRVDFYIWDSLMPIILPIDPLQARHEFDGYLPQKGLVDLALSPHCRIELLEAPFFVVSLREVEIVHLAVGLDHVDMTVVFKDFKRGVLDSKSIPITRLNGIRE